MVYPKHQALPQSPHKKYKKAVSACNTATSDNSAGSIMTDKKITFNIVHEMLVRCNAMIAMNASSIKDTQVNNAKNTAIMNDKFNALLHHVNALEYHVKDIAYQVEAKVEGRKVGARCGYTC